MSPVTDFTVTNTKDGYVTASMANIATSSISVEELSKNNSVQNSVFIIPPRGIRPTSGQIYPR